MHLALLGVGSGYAYTFVYRKKGFVVGSANVKGKGYVSREMGEGIHKAKVGPAAGTLFRAGAGYNTPKWGLSFLWFTGEISADGGYSGYGYGLHTGSYRLIFVRRFATNRRTREMLNK